MSQSLPTSCDWRAELRNSIRSVDELLALGAIRPSERAQIEKIVKKFPPGITPHYAKLIDWNDSDDPLLQMVLPSVHELQAGIEDTGGEQLFTQSQGIQHKFKPTVVILLAASCFAYCRFCFRKRLFDPSDRGEEITRDIEKILQFISDRPEIENVHLTGGDPLVLSTNILESLLGGLRSLPQVGVIRLGTRALTYLPSRIISDPHLLQLLAEHSLPKRRINFVHHINHPRELSEDSLKAADLLLKNGVIQKNQTAFLAGVNDDAAVLRDLYVATSEAGIDPYYTFICRPVDGARQFSLPIYQAATIFEEATRNLTGTAKRSRLVISHKLGKIQILAVEGPKHAPSIYLQLHQSSNESSTGKIAKLALPPNAEWVDDIPGMESLE